MISELRLNLEVFLSGADMDSSGIKKTASVINGLRYGPEITLHAPFMDLSPGAVDARVRAVTIKRFADTLEIAGAVGAKAAVFHSGYEKWKYGLNVDIWLRQSLNTWSFFRGAASASGVKIAIENIFEDEPSSLRMLMEEIGGGPFGICFDTGHFNLFSKAPLDEWLGSLGQYIVELHIHDNDGTSDAHLPPGDGTFDFRRLFSSLKGKDLIYTIETHTPEGVLRGMERLKEYLSGF